MAAIKEYLSPRSIRNTKVFVFSHTFHMLGSLENDEKIAATEQNVQQINNINQVFEVETKPVYLKKNNNGDF